MKHFDFVTAEEIFCERCGSPANDLHHIHGRGKGKDVIENLAALCRNCHTLAHMSKISKSELQEIHNRFLKHQIIEL